MANTKHTPTPWGYDGDGFDSVAAQHCATDGYCIFPLDEEGMADGHICEMSDAEGDDEAEANAAFICKAVNNHESMLDALKALVGFADCVLAEPDRFGGVEAARNLRGPAFDDARAAIAKAEGK